jgi:hypothetical protein
VPAREWGGYRTTDRNKRTVDVREVMCGRECSPQEPNRSIKACYAGDTRLFSTGKCDKNITPRKDPRTLIGRPVEGKVEDALKKALKDGTLTVPTKFAAQQGQIVDILRKLSGRLEIKNADERRQVNSRWPEDGPCVTSNAGPHGDA